MVLLRSKTQHGRILEVIVLAFLLLVIGLILVPIRTGHEGAMSTACLSNAKQLATAFLIYRSDWDERAPNWDRWMDALQPYHKSSVDRCPAVRADSDADPALYGYAFNSGLSEVDCSKLARLDEVPLLYDSVNLARNASDPVSSLPDPPRKHKDTAKNIMAFADGHVRRLP